MSEIRTLPWYDRNAVSLADSIDNDYPPHEVATRIETYIVPKNKKAMVELLLCNLQREEAASAEGHALAYFTLVPKDGVTKTLLIASIYQKTVGVKDGRAIGGTLVLHEGDALTGLTADGATGGTIRYQMGYKISEFDAYPIEIAPFQVEMPMEDIQRRPPRDPRM